MQSPVEPEIRPRRRAWRAGAVEFDEATRELRMDGERRAIEAKPLALLQALLAEANMVVTKEALMAAAWDKIHVGDGSLTTAMSKLRTALGSQAHIVEAVHGIGYRIAVPVEERAATPPPAAPLSLQPGDPVPGRPQWRLERPLGAGPARDVWLARHQKTREARVFKFAETGARLDALKREATLSRVLRTTLGERDDFVPVLEWNFEQPPCFIELPYGGLDLLGWLAARGGFASLPLPARVAIVAQAAATLAAAHGAGVLHGDIKPANILVEDRRGGPHVRLVDFGAGGLTEAARTAALTVSVLSLGEPGADSRTGTLLYMAPEILAGGAPTVQADIYALGVLLYQMTIGSFETPITASWEADIADGLLRECIAAAAAGDLGKRLASAATLAGQLHTLDATRAKRARERADAAAAAALAAQARRASQRRPWLIMAAASLVLGVLATSAAALRAAHERNEARLQADRAKTVSLFFTQDLLGRGNPRNSGRPDETLMDAAASAEPMIGKRFSNDPAVAASIYFALAHVYENLSAHLEARAAYMNAAASFEKADGRYSADAAIARAQQAQMEAYARDGASLAMARKLIAQVEAAMPNLGPRQAEAEVSLLNAKGAASLADGDTGGTLQEFRAAGELAAKMPDRFDKDFVLRLRFREGQALSDLGQYKAARDTFAEIERQDTALHGPLYSDTLAAALEHAQALNDLGDAENCVKEVDALFPKLKAVLGLHHANTVMALGVRASALIGLGRYADAEQDERMKYDAAVAIRGRQSFSALTALNGLGDAQCREGNLRDGARNTRTAFETAAAAFGPRHPITQAMAKAYVLCLTLGKEFPTAQALLQRIDRNAAASVLDGSGSEAEFAVLDAAIAEGLGGTARARELLMPLRQSFTAGGDAYFRTWAEQLANAAEIKR